MPSHHNLKTKIRRSVYISGFFLSIHLAFTAYISSSFLSGFIDPTYIGTIYSIASILAIAFMFTLPTLIKKFGNVQTIITLNFILIVFLSILAFETTAWLAIGFFIIYYVVGLSIQYAVDLYLEVVSDDKQTGQIRNLFLTILNLAIMISLIATGLVLGDGENYNLIFLISLIALTPFWYISATRFKEITISYTASPLTNTIAHLWRAKTVQEKNINKALAIDFLINFFYSLMIIYLPLYLHQYIGLTWSAIGFIFAFMLLPFIILPPFLGSLADKKLGEKEILSAGLIITGLACILIALIDSPNPILWALVLLLSRVGISAVEGMKESFLFKHLTAGDAGLLSISRNTRPLAYVISPIIASVFLLFFDFKFIFIFLGLVMWFGLRYSLAIVDTK